MEEKGYLTIGQMLFKDSKFKVEGADGEDVLATRNKADNYSNSVLRDMLQNEVSIIFEKQRSLNSKYATIDFEKQYMEIFTSQRPSKVH